MALDDSALRELLALRTGDGVDLVRDVVRLVMQELIEIQASEVIGAKPYERTETRVSERNGHGPRLLGPDISVGRLLGARGGRGGDLDVRETPEKTDP